VRQIPDGTITQVEAPDLWTLAIVIGLSILVEANVQDLGTLCDLIRSAAAVELEGGVDGVQRKANGSLVTAADIGLQQRIRQDLTARWPQHGFLGEEMAAAEQQRLLQDPGQGLWVLDPLDGTTNFAAGIPAFAVSLALVTREGPQLGVVYDPSRRECFSAQRGRGAWLDGRVLTVPPFERGLERAVAIVDFKRLDAALATRLVTRSPFASMRNFGSVALEWCWLASGRGQVYIHGGQKLWDYAAGSLILTEAGGAVSGFDQPLFNLTPGPRAALGAANGRILAAVQDWLKAGP
jgi:myo-inositol-1(or 4)-monophosphatase